jgi:hypothetical protein
MTHESRFSSRDFGPVPNSLRIAPVLMPPIEVQSPSAIALVADLYFDRGFHAGFSRAIRDELAAIAVTAEQFLASTATSETDRAMLYAFVRQVQSRLAALPDEQSTCGDGAGI